jgi:L-serine dehydratase
MARALSGSEVNASMGRICAAPTAGASGILPAVLLGVAEQYGLPEQALLDAMLTSSGIGILIDLGATLSGARGGCQAECGASAAMAAAAAVELMGGTPAQALHAAAIALKNVMGLVCDPIAGLVECPCAKRNASGAANAMLSADLALAGIKSAIPLDEVIAAMARVGRMLPSALRETSAGGIAATPTALEYAKRILGGEQG